MDDLVSWGLRFASGALLSIAVILGVVAYARADTEAGVAASAAFVVSLATGLGASFAEKRARE